MTQALVVNASKGQRVPITKGTGIKNIILFVFWDPATRPGEKFDLDVAALFLDANKKLTQAKNLLYYGTPGFAHPDGFAIHSGDSLDGVATGPDETIAVRLDQIPADISSMQAVLTIFEGPTRGQNFGRVDNLKVQVLNADTQEVLVEFPNIADEFPSDTGLVLCELYRVGEDWNFKALGTTLGSAINDINDVLKLY